MTRERSNWPPQIVKLIKENFVAVATTLHGRPNDAEGQFYNSLPCAWGTGRYHAVTASGKSLCAPGGDNFCCNIGGAYERWKALPESERRPGAVKVPDMTTFDPEYPKRPAGSILLKSHNRILDRDARGDWCRKETFIERGNTKGSAGEGKPISNHEPGRTWVWVTEDKWRQLVPAQLKAGDAYPVPDPVALRILRLTMIDTIY